MLLPLLAGMTILAQAAAPETYLAPVVVELQKSWPSNRTINIVFHGHSVPSGYFVTPHVQSLDAYPNLVRIGLAERFPTSVFNVITTSIGGENSIDGAKRFESDVLTHRPDVIFIDYGLNDRGLEPTNVEAAWVAMVRAAKAKHIPVVLLTPTADLTAKTDDPNDPLSQRAESIREIAKKEGVGLVDSFKAFQSEKNREALMAQSNHPNRVGHEIVAKLILKWFPNPSKNGGG